VKSMFEFIKNLFPKPHNDLLARDQTYCVLDTETTGFDVNQGDRIVSIGAVTINNLEINYKTKYDQIIDPERDIPIKSSQVHGIYPRDIKGKPKIREVEHEFASFIGNNIIVGHNIDFDIGFIKNIIPYSELRLKFKNNIVLDTLNLAVSLLPELRSHGLTDLCHHFKILVSDRHTAYGDSLMTAKLFIKLITIAEQNGFRTIYDLTKLMKKSYSIKRHLTQQSHY